MIVASPINPAISVSGSSPYADRASYLERAEKTGGAELAHQLSESLDKNTETRLNIAVKDKAIRDGLANGSVKLEPIKVVRYITTPDANAPNISNAAMRLADRENIEKFSALPFIYNAIDIKSVASKGADVAQAYIEHLQNISSSKVGNGSGLAFTGVGKDGQVTHDVDEYAGWLYAATGKARQLTAPAVTDNNIPSASH